jgi:nucleotide-binding universal stress UspA family protein
MAGAIVLGYDGSPGADAALETAVGLAARFDDRLVIAFGVTPPGHGDEFKAHRDALREMAAGFTKEALGRANDAGVEAEAILVEKRSHEALIKAAEDNDARFIVVGSASESPIKGAILGSTPHKLLHVSETPVVVVPA